MLASHLSLLKSTDLTAPKRSSESRFSDPSFTRNRNSPIHRWVPWIAGFSREFVHDVIRRYLVERGTILDPFAGVGTTLIEGILLRHNAIGFEINPYAAGIREVIERILCEEGHIGPVCF